MFKILIVGLLISGAFYMFKTGTEIETELGKYPLKLCIKFMTFEDNEKMTKCIDNLDNPLDWPVCTSGIVFQYMTEDDEMVCTDYYDNIINCGSGLYIKRIDILNNYCHVYRGKIIKIFPYYANQQANQYFIVALAMFFISFAILLIC